MIMWIASYPKSGNTWVRALLSNFLLENDSKKNIFEKMMIIPSFPKKKFFKNIVDENILRKNYMELFKYFIKAQEKINADKILHILKTHNFYGSVNGNKFTAKDNTIGSIYIVRDPRSVAVSYAHHSNISYEKSVELMLNQTRLGLNDLYYPEARMSWNIHLNSWITNSQSNLIVRYEDLLKKTPSVLKDILNFINLFLKKKIEYNKKTILECINECSFKNLSSLEKNIGFAEKEKNNFFFRSAKLDEWKSSLGKDLIKKIEKNFYKEMKKLKYL